MIPACAGAIPAWPALSFPIAQLAERRTVNADVARSIRARGATIRAVAKRSKAPVCKSGSLLSREFESRLRVHPSTTNLKETAMAQPKVQRAPKPRNPIVRAIAARMLSVGAGRHKPPRGARRRAQEIDLAQRVRESGEW